MSQNDKSVMEKATLREANVARQKELGAYNQLTLAYRGNELAGEVGEACNVIKKIERERLGIRGSRDTVEHLAEELADVVICADLIAMAEGIDLEAAIATKFNSTSEKNGLATRFVPVNSYQRMREALEEIRDHWACQYDHPNKQSKMYEGPYGIGVTDGHRACANIARAALLTEDKS